MDAVGTNKRRRTFEEWVPGFRVRSTGEKAGKSRQLGPAPAFGIQVTALGTASGRWYHSLARSLTHSPVTPTADIEHRRRAQNGHLDGQHSVFSFSGGNNYLV